jgi:SAM-dependent methyltransferase
VVVVGALDFGKHVVGRRPREIHAADFAADGAGRSLFGRLLARRGRLPYQPAMFAEAWQILLQGEAAARNGAPLEQCLGVLRQMAFADFAELMFSLPRDELPALSAMLPRMAAVEDQRLWTGFSGETLLKQTVPFVRGLAHAYAQHCGRIGEARVLDFGCGYGRHLRLMAYYVDPGRLYGCDPMPASLGRCFDRGVWGQLARSEPVPATLPFAQQFDLIYAFSVFTHLAPRAMRQSLSALREKLRPGGLLAITIFPIEYWVDDAVAAADKTRMREQHRRCGFAFLPLEGEDALAVDGEATYGRTTMSVDYLLSAYPQFRLKGLDRALEDPYQSVVYLS